MAGGYTLSEGAVRKLAGLVRGGMTEARRGASSPSAVSFDGYALPFTVRWAASEGQSGAWVVWLPTLADLVSYAGASCTLSGVTAATSLPAGWYTVANAATAMYLVVTIEDPTDPEPDADPTESEPDPSVTAELSATSDPTESEPDPSGADPTESEPDPDPIESEPDPSVTAELSAAPGTAGTGETVYNLLVATMSTNATTGAKRVKQYVVGAVALGGGGVTVGTPKTAATSIEYTDDHDASHPYAIKLTRGYLAASANTLTIDPQDGETGTTADLTQYIETVPISDVVDPNVLSYEESDAS